MKEGLSSMSMNKVMADVEAKSLRSDKFNFEIGDSVDVQVRILEGDKERLQPFSGIVIARRGGGTRENFTVRRIVEGEGVERTFPLHSPKIAAIVVTRKSKVRRAKLYFLRDRIGKKAYRLKERPMNAPPVDAEKKPTRKGRKAKAETAAAAPAAPAAKASAAKKEKKRAARAKKKDA
jgi:large subunit ribosomal protein L19